MHAKHIAGNDRTCMMQAERQHGPPSSASKSIVLRWACAILAISAFASASPQQDTLDAVRSRWQRIPPLEVVATYSGRAFAISRAEEDPWDRRTWRPTGRVRTCDVLMRASGEDWAAEVTPSGDFADSSGELWFSFVAGEFIALSGLDREQPSAGIQTKTVDNTLSVQKFLTPFEHQFFDIYEPWSSALARLQCQGFERETVDGFECLRVECKARTGPFQLVLWVVPELDFAPARARLTIVTDASPSPLVEWEMRVTEHLPVGSSWIVGQANLLLYTSRHPDDGFVSEYQVLRVTTGPEVTPRSLRERFPPNTLVQDFVRGETWHADGLGGRPDLRPLDEGELDKVARAIRAEIDRPSIQRSRHWALGGIIGASVILVILLVVARRRWVSSQ